MENFKKVLNIKRKFEDTFLKIDGIHGVGIGYENLELNRPDEICIWLHLHKQSPIEKGLIPNRIEGVKICTLEAERPVPMGDTKKYRPLMGGIKIETDDGQNGTLGCIVVDKTNGKKVALSCYHILSEDSIVGQPICKIKSWIGRTRRGILSQRIDAAICSVRDDHYSPMISQVGEVNGFYNVTIDDLKNGGYAIRKRGMATGLTFGMVKQIHFTGIRSDGWKFHDQLWIEGYENVFATEGDSGSVYVDMHYRIIGLHWGGQGYNFGIGSPIANIIDELNIEVPSFKSNISNSKALFTENLKEVELL